MACSFSDKLRLYEARQKAGMTMDRAAPAVHYSQTEPDEEA